MDPSSPSPQKKGLGPLAWVGIGCGSIVVLGIIAFTIFGFVFGPKLKKFALVLNLTTVLLPFTITPT